MDDSKESVKECSVRQSTFDVYIFRCVILTIVTVLTTVSIFSMFVRWEELQMIKDGLNRGSWTIEALI
jgi:hypothetical protein